MAVSAFRQRKSVISCEKSTACLRMHARMRFALVGEIQTGMRTAAVEAGRRVATSWLRPADIDQLFGLSAWLRKGSSAPRMISQPPFFSPSHLHCGCLIPKLLENTGKKCAYESPEKKREGGRPTAW